MWEGEKNTPLPTVSQDIIMYVSLRRTVRKQSFRPNGGLLIYCYSIRVEECTHNVLQNFHRNI
jgi:hypothetical protein